MAELVKGERVRVMSGPWEEYIGQIGTVEMIDSAWRFPYGVRFPDDEMHWFSASQLERIPAEPAIEHTVTHHYRPTRCRNAVLVHCDPGGRISINNITQETIYLTHEEARGLRDVLTAALGEA